MVAMTVCAKAVKTELRNMIIAAVRTTKRFDRSNLLELNHIRPIQVRSVCGGENYTWVWIDRLVKFRVSVFMSTIN